MAIRVSRLLPVAVAAVSVLALVGCSSGEKPSAEKLSAVPVAAKAAIKPAADCKDGRSPVASLAPGNITADPDSVRNSPTMDRIKKNDRLTVGTSGDVLLWGSRNPRTGKLEGYDIDLLDEFARRLGVPITYKVINYTERLTTLEAKSVDLVAHTMTINCDRWQGSGQAPNAINFSSEYYPAGQRVLVRSDSSAKSVKDVKGKICVPAGSTNIGNATAAGVPKANLVELDAIGNCLVKFQEGEVDAITGDDTVLAGFAAQDAYAKVVGAAFSSEPYGLGISQDDPQFTRFVNAVLEELRSDGTLQRLYTRWMAEAVDGPPPAIPQPKYDREPSALGRR
jgi:polar amino acid transport system substrate-binding protein